MHKRMPLLHWWLQTTAAAAVLAASHAACAAVIDDFEPYVPGSFPGPGWNDVAGVLPQASPYINAPLPSASIVTTTDAHGQPTQAMQTVNALGIAKGIYAPVPVSSSYSLFADMRTVQYADTDPSFASTVSDWSMQLTFAQAGTDNFAFTPQAGIYASSLTQGWRLYLVGTNGGVYEDIDLGVPATIDTWYSIALDVDINTGSFHSTIVDTATGAVLGDTTHLIAGWQPQFGAFDSIAFFAGEVAAQDPAVPGSTTVPNIGQVDNVNITTSPVPLPASLLLMASGLLAFMGGVRRERRV